MPAYIVRQHGTIFGNMYVENFHIAFQFAASRFRTVSSSELSTEPKVKGHVNEYALYST
jgi:hypothetical protein